MEIEKVPLTKENLKIIKKLDDKYYKDDITSLDWYLERYTPKHTAYLIKDNNKVVGYITAVPIKKEAYKAITDGVLVDDVDINPEMFVEKSRYHYVVSFVILDGYCHQGIGTNIILQVIKTVEHGKYCALTITKAGASLSKKFMTLKKQINDHTAVFEIKI